MPSAASNNTLITGNDSFIQAYELAIDSNYSYSVININISKGDTAATTITLAVSTGSSPSPDEYIETSLTLNDGEEDGVLNTGIFILPGSKVFVKSSAVDVSCVITGLSYLTSDQAPAVTTIASSANNWVEAYALPGSVSGKSVNYGTLTIGLVNTGTSSASVDIALANSNPPGAGDHLLTDKNIEAYGGTVEVPCTVLSPGQKIYVKSDNSTVSIRVQGLLRTI